ncbi:MAG: UbiA family prenyltransferase [Gemmatimonadaceae bacterium]
MSRWLTYLRERSPLPTVLTVAAAQALSAYYLFRSGFDARAIALSAAGVAGLLVLMRMGDEVKDYEKDLLAHPGRPLPRGLITPAEMRSAIRFFALLLFVYAALLAVLCSLLAGALYAATVGYALLMYKEFFIPRMLNANAFFYALTHQLIVLPMYAFATASAASPAAAFSRPALWFALTGLGASFTLEICRKLDPAAHPALCTYLHVYGRRAAMFAVAASLSLLLLASYQMKVHWIVAPFVALTVLSLTLLFRRPDRFKAAEGAAALLGIVQMLAPTLLYAYRSFT